MSFIVRHVSLSAALIIFENGCYSSSTVKKKLYDLPSTVFLGTGRIYTITVYPSAVGSNILSNPLNFGVEFHPGCRRYRWFQGKKRLRNTKARLRLTKVEGAPGIYSISRNTRRFKGWFYQIEIIVASESRCVLLEGGMSIYGLTDKCSMKFGRKIMFIPLKLATLLVHFAKLWYLTLCSVTSHDSICHTISRRVISYNISCMI